MLLLLLLLLELQYEQHCSLHPQPVALLHSAGRQQLLLLHQQMALQQAMGRRTWEEE